MSMDHPEVVVGFTLNHEERKDSFNACCYELRCLIYLQGSHYPEHIQAEETDIQ